MLQLKKQFYLKLVVFVVIATALSSCMSSRHTMREPNVRVELNKADFTLSNQVSAKAQTVKILGIDWARLFTKRTGHIDGGPSISAANIPVIGNMVSDRTANYALYELMRENPNYDVVFFPQFERTVSRPALGIGFLYRVTTVRATARLGRLNDSE